MITPNSFKKRICEIVEPTQSNNPASKYFDIFFTVLISLNIVAIILESFKHISVNYELYFETFETISIMFFTIEYLLRLWTYKVNYKYDKSNGFLKHVFSPLSIIDLLAILPFYLPMLFPFDARVLRIFRLIRTIRIFKLSRYTNSFRVLGNVLINKKEDLFVTVFVILMLLIMASSFMYYFEHEAQPETFSNIIASMWWGVATLTTVGYGDIYPITIPGKILGSIIALMGIGLFALPAGILGSGFIEELRKGKEKINCPHCGKTLDNQ